MIKYGVSLLFVLYIISIINVNSDCIYTDISGRYCNCDGSNEDCLVASISWEECGDDASTIHVLVDQCIQSKAKEKKDKKKVAYKQQCANGDVSRQWFTTQDCTGPVSKIEALSASYQPCATISCIKSDDVINTYNDDKNMANNNIININIINSFIISIIIIITIF